MSLLRKCWKHVTNFRCMNKALLLNTSSPVPRIIFSSKNIKGVIIYHVQGFFILKRVYDAMIGLSNQKEIIQKETVLEEIKAIAN